MSEECTHNCESCGANCPSKNKESMLAEQKTGANIKKIVAVISGKGGVGKSMVTSLLAVLSQRSGNSTAILDADVTGPSIPKEFNIKDKAESDGTGIYPVLSKTGIKIMSTNLLLPDEKSPVIWRGPVIAGLVQQFYTDVYWQDVDLMLIDCPPGTGDVPLTVFQSIPVDGIVVVTSPQDLVSMIVEKAVKMAQMMNIPILGIVENMSYFECPDCKKSHYIFGNSNIEKIASEYGIDCVAKIPIDQKLSAASDAGLVELFEGDWLDGFYEKISK